MVITSVDGLVGRGEESTLGTRGNGIGKKCQSKELCEETATNPGLSETPYSLCVSGEKCVWGKFDENQEISFFLPSLSVYFHKKYSTLVFND